MQAWPETGSCFLKDRIYGRESSLSPDPIALCVGKVAIVAIFGRHKTSEHAVPRQYSLGDTTSARVWDTSWCLRRARRRRTRAGHSNQHVISVG